MLVLLLVCVANYQLNEVMQRGLLILVPRSLVKYNKKTVTVITESGQKWNVSPHLLSKVKNCAGKDKNAAHVRLPAGKT